MSVMHMARAFEESPPGSPRTKHEKTFWVGRVAHRKARRSMTQQLRSGAMCLAVRPRESKTAEGWPRQYSSPASSDFEEGNLKRKVAQVELSEQK